MRIALCIVSMLFGGLSMVAASVQIKKEGPALSSVLMSGGACLLTVGVVFCALAWPVDWLAALLGCGLICYAAILNGKKSGNFHIQHHIIRIALSVLLTVGFVVW